MKALRQLGFLKLSLRPERPPDEDHRVLELFRNRAELKKAYGGLQDETFRLKDLIKQQEGATQRVQEMLSALEGRLGTPETAYGALVFYQLRRLWQAGRELITQFVTDLARQQEERERRVHLAQHNQRQFARRQSAQKQLDAAQALHEQASAQVAALEGERAALTRFWHYFKRRALGGRIHAAQAQLGEARAALAQAQAAAEELARESLPEFPGLSLQARLAAHRFDRAHRRGHPAAGAVGRRRRASAERARRRHLGPVPHPAALRQRRASAAARGLLLLRQILRAAEHVRHHLAGLIEHHVGGVLGLVQLLHALVRGQVLGGAPTVLALQALL